MQSLLAPPLPCQTPQKAVAALLMQGLHCLFKFNAGAAALTFSVFLLSFFLSLSPQLPALLLPFLNDEWGIRYKKLTVVERERLFLCETGWTHPSKTWMLILNDFSVLKHYSLAKKYSISVETGWTMSTVVALLWGKVIQPQIICKYYSLIHKVSKARYVYNYRICHVYTFQFNSLF